MVYHQMAAGDALYCSSPPFLSDSDQPSSDLRFSNSAVQRQPWMDAGREAHCDRIIGLCRGGQIKSATAATPATRRPRSAGWLLRAAQLYCLRAHHRKPAPDEWPRRCSPVNAALAARSQIAALCVSSGRAVRSGPALSRHFYSMFVQQLIGCCSVCAVADRWLFSLCSRYALSVQSRGGCLALKPIFNPLTALSRAGFGPKSSSAMASIQANTVFMVSAEIGGPPPFSQTTSFALV